MLSLVSRVVPLANSVTAVPPLSCIRIKGDIELSGSRIEQELLRPGFEPQSGTVPGPSVTRSRLMEPNVMNPAKPAGGGLAKSLMVPKEVFVRVNGAIPLVTRVGVPA